MLTRIPIADSSEDRTGVKKVMAPARPDLEEVAIVRGKREGMEQVPHRWSLATVGENDMIVVGIFEKMQWVSFGGDCLATSASRAGCAGVLPGDRMTGNRVGFTFSQVILLLTLWSVEIFFFID